MTDADAVRRVAAGLPRSYERLVGRRWKLKVKQLVYVSFSEDEQAMGFGFPRDQRDALVAAAPDVFFMPPASDLRYQWVCARLGPLADDEMRELVLDAWRMCVPAFLHDLPDLPAPTARLWDLIERQEWADARALLHPQVRWTDRALALRGRRTVLAHLAGAPTPRPPDEVLVRDGQVVRWAR